MSSPVPKRRRRNRTTVSGDELSQISSSNNNEKHFTYCGTLQRIILKNVFCHEYLDFDGFSTATNLLQGANGSGKSSIVAAIIAGLGGTSRTTDRGASLKNLIKNGKQWASIEIHLRNDGFNAYKPELFGGTIIIERRLQINGINSFKIKSELGQTIYTKKEELKKILDKFSFEVDNPVLILSQERAKKFLRSTNPSSLYNFFMTSTQLKQWEDEITEAYKTLASSQILLSQKNTSLKLLGEDVKGRLEKINAIKAIQNRRGTLIKLSAEKLWAEVNKMEKEISDLEHKKTATEKIANKLENVLSEVQTKISALEKESKKSDDNMIEISKEIKVFEAKRDSGKSEMQAVRAKYLKKLSEKKNLDKEVFERERDVASFKKKLEEDNNEATVVWEQNRNKLKEEEEKIRGLMKGADEAISMEEQDMKTINGELQVAEEEAKHLVAEAKFLKESLKRLKAELENTKQQKDSLTVFGQYIPNVIREINRASRKFSKMPIGPLGHYIKVKKEEWVHVVENATASLLTAFLVSCNRDFKVLDTIFSHEIPKGVYRPKIIISPFRDKVHDVRRFEVRSDNYFSMWSIIETDNTQVANTLLDQLHVESILLVPQCTQAIELLVDRRRVPANCEKAMTLNGDIVFPDPNHGVYSGTGNRRVQYLQVSVEDKIRDLRLNMQSTEKEVHSSENEVKKQEITVKDLLKKKTVLKNEIETHKIKKNEWLRALQELRNKEVPPPPDVYQLQSDLNESEALKAEAEQKLVVVMKDLKVLEAELKEAEERRAECQRKGEEIQKAFHNYQVERNEINEQLTRCKKEKIIYNNKMNEINNNMENFDSKIKDLTKKCNDKIEEVKAVNPERIQTNKSVIDIEREIKALKKVIEVDESKFGDLEEITSQWQEKTKKYSTAKEDLRMQYIFISKMNKSLEKRDLLFKTCKKLYRILLRTTFQYFINKRNMSGHIDLNYAKEAITIMMKKGTNDHTIPMQSLAMMSGGERSFATVSFILSLWDMVYSPIRIMDEFDIFMDVVSRSQCVEMILESVKKEIQYIMVSPLEYRFSSNLLRIFRMPDPERNDTEST